jgi:hypothetical protein
MKNEVEYNKILENNIEALKCYNNILKNNKINCYEYGWMKTFKIELNDIEYKREFKKYLKNVDLKQKEKYIDLMEFVKWINICYKLDVFKINKIVQDYIDVEYVKYKSADYRATLNPILKINRMIRYYHDLLIQLNLLSETPEQPIQQTKEKNLVQPPPKPLHFTKCFTTDEQKNLFDGLIKAGLLEKEKYSHFCYVFGGTDIPDNEKPFKPLQWAGTLKELHYFITKCFPKEINQWKKAVNCFIKENESINKKSLSTAMDKYDNLPESSATIDKLCK